MAWWPGDKQLSEPMMFTLLTHIYVPLGLNELFYHGVGEISDLSQSEAPNLVMWRVMVMQPRPRLLGDEVVVGPNLMFRKRDPWNVIRNILQDKTDKNQL